MAKNENNSHAFIRKMIENIKQTKDGQCPDDPKINEVCVVSIRNALFFLVVLLYQLLLFAVKFCNTCQLN